YHDAIDSEKAAKLTAMTHVADPDLLEVAAWPVGTLHTGPSRKLVGILMPKISGFREIHQLYSPAQRRVEFPTVDWSFLVHAALNLAHAFAEIHARGHVVGDVNQGNIVVSARALMKFIDCDSFQITVDGHRFLCEVGV